MNDDHQVYEKVKKEKVEIKDIFLFISKSYNKEIQSVDIGQE